MGVVTQQLPDNWRLQNRYDTTIAFDGTLFSTPLTPLFASGSQEVIATASGRGSARFIRFQEQIVVVRHYLRGGGMAPLLGDNYLYTGWQRSRPVREVNLLHQLWRWALPVPRPVALQLVRHHALWWRGDLATLALPEVTPLLDHLCTTTLADELWREIGATLARFHRRGVYHADLNGRNILLDSEQKIWLIDFDRGQLRRPARRWQQANLQRLLRSLLKWQRQQPDFRFTPKHWQALLEGYQRELP
ncbi:3-deoxy-D-manno-octulosonic acid kinase [Ectothiorhodospiraceae bacterium BW-2]|nr:3-deoxy-D-manno-octulosonic acid kinase [Ectothiorhodospiraceae bacterium BW-2]